MLEKASRLRSEALGSLRLLRAKIRHPDGGSDTGRDDKQRRPEAETPAVPMPSHPLGRGNPDRA
ncbi:hypothetical protein [Erythrobacter sp. THAF29]|uniref:hypothetical protein n=1 Tax=Erythrobacter sp. THAF29 TaxID=2587851 RepID=UPI001268B069|nr:hypothetical protein [Erythrobacter sp. THAF29]